MSNITYVLDACSVINLIHIDEEEALIKRLANLKILITEQVFREIIGNVYHRIPHGIKSDKKRIAKERSRIDQLLTIFRRCQILDSQIKHDMGPRFFSLVEKLSNYKKKNGEFYSTVLSLYISRIEPTKLFFCTDDFPAKKEFKEFFSTQQIGYIEDSSDLLLLLYRLDDGFSYMEFDKTLSKLFSEYASQVAILEKKLREYQIPARLAKDRVFRNKLFELKKALNVHEFSGIRDIRDFFQQRKYATIRDIVKEYPEVFELDSTSTSLMEKITNLRRTTQKDSVFKL